MPDPSLYASKSDADLRALEKDGSLPADAWKAVTDELQRRQKKQASASAPAATRSVSAPAAHDPGLAELESEPRIGEALRQLRGLLVTGEQLEAVAIQRRLFALTHRRMIVAATSGRLIIVSRGFFGGYTPVNVRWQDIEDAKVRMGVFGASLSASSLNQEDLASAGHVGSARTVPGLRKDQAERVYRVSQAQEQSWREKRRIRDLDELRAKSGGVQVGMQGLGAMASAGGDEDPVARLQRAKEMLDNRLITDAEFESIKARIVDRL